MRRLDFLLLPLSAIALAQFPGSQDVSKEVKKGYDAIEIGDAKKHLGFLVKCNGRESGTPGYRRAADYVAAKFREDGLKPGGDNGSYFQYGTLYRAHVNSGSLKFGNRTIKVGKDLNLGETYASVNATAPIYLIRVREKMSDLPEGINLKGAIVLLSGPGVDASIRIDIREQAPVAMFYVKQTVARTVWSVRQRKPDVSRVIGSISENAVTDLIKTAGVPEGMTQAVETFRLGDATLDAKVTAEEVKVPNVVGVLPGVDPLLKDEVVGIGGHLDHLGDNGEKVYPGADDDGSGSTAVLQIARAFAKNPVKPKRTIVFMTFYGEEMGLLGSRLYASKPTYPLDKWVAQLQMDMVARDSFGPQNGDTSRIDKVEENRDTMRLVGSKRISSELHEAVLNANRYVNFRFLYDGEDVYERSDHYSFAIKGVPVAFLFDGFTPDYHQPTDTVDKINWLKLTNAAKLFYLTAWDIANRDKRLVKDAAPE